MRIIARLRSVATLLLSSLALAALMTTTTVADTNNTPAEMQPRKPNIIFILTDDLSMNLVQYMPNVQAMQRDGATFTKYFVTDSLCCPSRSSIFTGKFPHNTHVLTNVKPDGGYQAFNSHGNQSQTFAVALQADGYRTAMLGKYLNGYEPPTDGVPQGWNEWDVAGNGYPEFNYVLNENRRIVQYGTDPKDYLTDVVGAIADQFVRKSDPGPFFIEIATFAPHAPYIPAPRDGDTFPGLTAPRGPAFGWRAGPDAPHWLREIPPLRPMEIKRIDKDYRMRAQAVQAVDKMIGELRATLAMLGDQNTYIVFSSDNGYHMGEYSLRPGKQTAFDTDIHVPLIIVGPGVAKGAVVDAITENVDLGPTFAQLGGGSGAMIPDGHSLVPLFSGSTPPDWRHSALIEHKKPGPAITDPDMQIPQAANPVTYDALRLDSALYVEYEDGEVSYYDITRDPNELSNIAQSMPPAIREGLHRILAANKSCQGTPACWSAQHMTP